MRYASYTNFDAIGTIQAARQRQLQSLMSVRSSNFPYSTGGGSYQQPSFGGYSWGGDTVTLSGQTWPYSSGGGYSYGNGGSYGGGYGYGNGYGYGTGNSSVPPLPNGQTIEEIFANPYAGTDMGYLQEALDKIAAAREMYGVQPPRKEGQKGDLRVIAGDRSDGVKPREVRIDDANNYDYQKSENNYQDNRYETRFKDGTIGREYDVTVTWEDGSTTRKRVKLKEAGQIVYMNSAYSY